MYDVGKILVAGGGPSTNDRRVIDINGADADSRPDRRRWRTAAGRTTSPCSPTARVLATGGNSSGASLVDLNAGVYAAELWNPATGQWTDAGGDAGHPPVPLDRAAAARRPRAVRRRRHLRRRATTVGYLEQERRDLHPAVPVHEGRVRELAPARPSPPPLRAVTYGTQFTVSTPDAASISKVALVRLGAVTHSNNMEQRYVPLSFTAAQQPDRDRPANTNIAPPGYYMLFIVNSAGVPSVAPIVRVKNAPPTVQITAPRTGSAFPSGSKITINATASASDGAVQKVEFYAGTTKLGQSTTAPYSFIWPRPRSGTYALTARATDNAGLKTKSAPVTVTVR